MFNLSVILEDSARRYPEKDAFVFMNKGLSYTKLNTAANQVAAGLQLYGIQPGDKVALSCLNLPYFPIVYFGILKAGAVVVPLSVLLKRDEIEYHLKDSEAKAYFCFQGVEGLPMLDEGKAAFDRVSGCETLIAITPRMDDESPFDGVLSLGQFMSGEDTVNHSILTNAEDTAVIIYTSGTTGKPKGAELTHNNLFLNAMLSTDIIGTKQEDVQLIVLPLFHIFAMTCLMNAGILKGSTSILLPRFDAETVLGLMTNHKVSVFAGVPTMYWGLLNYESKSFDLVEIASNMRICVSGGASLPIAVLEGFEEKFKVEILEGYGMSEGSPVVTFNQKETGRKPGSVGTPVWGVEVKVVDEEDREVPVGEKGELIYRGHNVMKGYYNRPEVNEVVLRGGWLHSGDVAKMDEDGFFYIVDRTKDMIIRGGLNVYPREVEDVIMQHEAVSLVAVIGIPDDKYGEEIKACVVLKEGESVSDSDLIEFSKSRIAAYKYPRKIEFLDSLPMSATGKILKKELRNM